MVEVMLKHLAIAKYYTSIYKTAIVKDFDKLKEHFSEQPHSLDATELCRLNVSLKQFLV